MRELVSSLTQRFMAIALILSTGCGSDTPTSPATEGYRSIRTIGRTATDPAEAMLGVGCRIATTVGDSATVRFAPRLGRPQLFDCFGLPTDSVAAGTRRYLDAAMAADGDASLMDAAYRPVLREWCFPSDGWWQSDGTWYLPPGATMDQCVWRVTWTLVPIALLGQEDQLTWDRLPLPPGDGGAAGGSVPYVPIDTVIAPEPFDSLTPFDDSDELSTMVCPDYVDEPIVCIDLWIPSKVSLTFYGDGRDTDPNAKPGLSRVQISLFPGAPSRDTFVASKTCLILVSSCKGPFADPNLNGMLVQRLADGAIVVGYRFTNAYSETSPPINGTMLLRQINGQWEVVSQERVAYPAIAVFDITSSGKREMWADTDVTLVDLFLQKFERYHRPIN